MNQQEKKPSNPTIQQGWTLRDEFANTALLGMFSPDLLKLSDDVVKNTEKTRAEWFAEQSYNFADAMLKQREL